MKRIIVAGIALALLAVAGGYYMGGHAQRKAQVAAEPVRKVLYWYDPMVPGQRFDKPGKSPFMDMQLVPRYADDTQAASGVTVSAEQQQNLGMITAQVQRRALTPRLQSWGTIVLDERSLRTVSSPASGVVEKLFVNATQQWVRAGEPLVQLWIPAWTSAQQEYLAVRQLGDPALTRAARDRLALQFMPESIVRALEHSGTPQTRLTLRAEHSGFVSKLDTREGAQVAATAPLLELADLKSVWLVVDYPQRQAALLTAGTRIEATTESWPGERFSGQVSELLPQMETNTRTLKARIVLNNAQQKLKPGMYLSVTALNDADARNVLAVPEEAVMFSGQQSRVIVAREQGRFAPVNVTTGLTVDGWTEIVDGLREGERVVTSGQFLIDSEASLRSALPSSAHIHSAMPAEVKP